MMDSRSKIYHKYHSDNLYTTEYPLCHDIVFFTECETLYERLYGHRHDDEHYQSEDMLLSSMIADNRPGNIYHDRSWVSEILLCKSVDTIVRIGKSSWAGEYPDEYFPDDMIEWCEIIRLLITI